MNVQLTQLQLFNGTGLKGGNGEFSAQCELKGIPLSNGRYLTNLGKTRFLSRDEIVAYIVQDP